jgi:hypothetical protein
MKMTELTKEWLQKTIAEIEDVLNANPNKCNDSDVVNMLAALKIAQSSLRAETVLWQLKKAKPDCGLPDKAMGYLGRNGLIGAEDALR